MEPKLPRWVFRRLQSEEHARQLLGGVIWLPTLASIRDPDHTRSDEDEGRARWLIPRVDESTDAQTRKGLLSEISRTFIHGNADMSTWTFIDCVAGQVEDAYVLCTSLDRSKTGYGPFCVRITDPRAFTQLVARALVNADRQEFRWKCRNVIYGREAGGPVAPDPYFAGTAGNESEREFRMAWTPVRGGKISPRAIFVPEAGKLCSMV